MNTSPRLITRCFYLLSAANLLVGGACLSVGLIRGWLLIGFGVLILFLARK